MKFKAYLQGFFKYTDLLKELVARDIKIRYRRSFLGLLWTLFNPLLMMLVMTLIFSYLFRSEIPNFPVYYLSGYILFNFCTEATTMGLSSIVSNAALIKKVYIPKYLFPVSKVVSCLVNLMFSVVALIIVMLITQTKFYPTMFLLPIPILYVFVFTVGFSLFLAAVTVFFRDVAHFYSIITLTWMYLTPLFYPVSILPETLTGLARWNPMYRFIEYIRVLILDGGIPDLKANLICFGIAGVMLMIGLVVFYRKQDKFILHV